jgi:hypothetical protein
MSGGSTTGVAESAPHAWQRPDWTRTLQLALAAVWLLDGILQLQPFMFTAGSKGFSGMLGSMASGNPGVVAHSIRWNASLVDHHAIASNSAFALIQIVIGLGIAWRPSLKPALAVSVVWSLGVWWFGEGLGGVLQGNGTPIGGGPGAVLFYALLAILLWPVDRSEDAAPFAAARAIGTTAAKAVWGIVWVVLAGLCLLGSGRSPQGVSSLIQTVDSGEPGWLAGIDRHAASLVSDHGLLVALIVAVIFLSVAVAVFLPVPVTRVAIVAAIVTAVVIWVVVENFGMILAGGATDPNSGPLLVLLALAFYPFGVGARPVQTPVRESSATPVEVVSP